MSRWNNIFDKKNQPNKKELQSYLSGKSSKEITRKVEHAMSSNPLLSDAVDGFSELGSDYLHKVPTYQQFRAERTPLAKIRQYRPFVNKLVATTLLCVLLASVYLYWGQNAPEQGAGKVYADNFVEFYDPSIDVLRGADDTTPMQSIERQAADEKLKEKAILLFKEEKLDKAIHKWELYLQHHLDDVQSLFYLGYMYLKKEDSQRAIFYLEQIADIENSDYKEETRYYLGLAYWKSGNTKWAKRTLEEVVQEGDKFFAEKAQKILEEIN